MAGKIIRRIANKFLLITASDEIITVTVRKNLPALAVGDWVEYLPSVGGSGVITGLNPRRNLITRPNPLNKFDKPVIANIDLILAVVAPNPKPDLSLLDEYAILAEYHTVDLIIVANKTDIANIDDLLLEYRQLNYQIIATSANQQFGIKPLTAVLVNKVGIFVGQSGVGKSSLINCLVPDQQIKTKQLSSTDLGKHTTSDTCLYFLANGGAIVDSPGIREFGLWKLSRLAIIRGFKEIIKHSANCKFNNCRHLKEPKCAVKTAVANGEISQRRYKNYCNLTMDCYHK